MSTGGKGLAMAAIFMGLMIAGCVDSQPAPSHSQVGALLVEGRISYNLTVEGQEYVGALNLTGPFEAVDRFHRPATMFLAVDWSRDWTFNEYWLMTEARRIEMVGGDYGGWSAKYFGHRSLPYGDQGLAPLLLLVHGRDWHGGATYDEYLWGDDHTLVGAWQDDELVVRGKSELSGFEARYTFAPEERGLHALRKIFFAREHDPGIRDHNATYLIRNLTGPLQPIDLPVHSTKPTTVWKPLALDEFLDASRLPMVFPLERAWEHLEQDPRTMDWMTSDAEPLVAYYHRRGSGHMPSGEWSLGIDLEDGYGSADIEQGQVAGQDLVPIVHKYDKRDMSHHEPVRVLYGWDAVLENCALHAGVEPGTVQGIEYAPSNFAHGLDYHPHVLQITYTSDTDPPMEVLCQHDSVTGLPIAVFAEPVKYLG